MVASGHRPRQVRRKRGSGTEPSRPRWTGPGPSRLPPSPACDWNRDGAGPARLHGHGRTAERTPSSFIPLLGTRPLIQAAAGGARAELQRGGDASTAIADARLRPRSPTASARSGWRLRPSGARPLALRQQRPHRLPRLVRTTPAPSAIGTPRPPSPIQAAGRPHERRARSCPHHPTRLTLPAAYTADRTLNLK